MEDVYIRSLRQYLWHILAGTKGGVTRIHILSLLRDRPYNANQLHEKLTLDYKTVQHHLRVLSKGNLITTDGEKSYGAMYFISPILEDNMHLLDEIMGKIGKNELKGG